MNLESLLQPISLDEFDGSYWSKQFLRIARADSTFYDDIFSEQDMENTLYTASRFPGAVQEIAEDTVIRNIRTPEEAVNTFNAKRSMRITGIQRFCLPLAKLSRNLARIISSPININLYMSPFSGQKALPRHYDTHDVMVLQISGNKRWKIFEPRVEFPLEALPRLQHEAVEDVRRYRIPELGVGKEATNLVNEFVLEPGDFLYLPRGFYHEALTDSDAGASCHLTIGIKPTTYLDLLTLAVSDAAYSDVRLRQHLPLGFANRADLQSEAIRIFDQVAEELSPKLDANKALAQLMGIFHRAYKGALENQLFDRQASAVEINAISLNTRVGVREGMIIGIDYNAAPAQLCFGESRFAVQDEYLEACRFICDNRAFLPAMLPGGLTDEQRLSLIRQLVVENVAFIEEDERGFA
jgi:ribosomal protein L16 Arg81 hydroxylase